MRFVFWAALCAAVSLLYTDRASALPVFAHRYGFSCQQCHTVVPQLNSFGAAFAKSGFRLNLPTRGTLPVAVKVNLQYTSDKDTQANLPKGVVDEIELLSGGRLGNNTSYFVEQYAIDGGKPGATRDAWLQFDTSRIRVRAGQFTLPLPVDPESERPTQQHYAVFDQTVGNNPFNLFDPRAGIDVSFETSGSQVHLVGLQSSDAMLSVSHDVNDNLALYAYRYEGGRHEQPVSNRFWRQGYGLTYDDRRFGIAAVEQTGDDTSSDALGTPARSSGGFLQGRYTFNSGAALYYRYDRAFDDIAGEQHGNTLSLVMRPRRNYRLTVEATQAQHHTAFTTALLFAY